jgi:hypothetical protein
MSPFVKAWIAKASLGPARPVFFALLIKGWLRPVSVASLASEPANSIARSMRLLLPITAHHNRSYEDVKN